MLFLVGAVIIGVIARFGEEGTVNTIVAGASDFLGAGLVIVAARGITVVMKNTYITDTILHWMEDAVSGSSTSAFAELAFLVNLPIAFLVPSSSGHAALVMPILAPLADFAGVPGRSPSPAFQSASGFVNYLTPTSAVVMGGLTLAKVGYDRYIRFARPFMAVMFVLLIVHLHGNRRGRWGDSDMEEVIVVVALGGNALLRRGDQMTARSSARTCAIACEELAPDRAEARARDLPRQRPADRTARAEAAAYERRRIRRPTRSTSSAPRRRG